MNSSSDSSKQCVASPFRWYGFNKLGDFRGALTSIESEIDTPFPIKRVYYLYYTLPQIRRGFHAHKTLQQILVCITGQCKVLLDDGNVREDIQLSEPNLGLYVDTMVWHEMYDFSPDCVLLVLASDHYQESDYIRNYADFMSAVKGMKQE
ncbi:MAG: FdtA/QdtA family cupin domain-containing protein [Gammaproteobacteria bacterium]|nr:FdtA/QdtA family cupin domain-containing protein [Gammaproteobacteria bacterium]MCD8542817.1 FdtA/QdtA family cupin domain-containing protein [Gammaproteobacteria bacterium]